MFWVSDKIIIGSVKGQALLLRVLVGCRVFGMILFPSLTESQTPKP